MKVAFISYLYPPRSIQGGAKIAHKLSEALELEGVEVKRFTRENISSRNFLEFAWKASKEVSDCDIVHGTTLGDLFVNNKPCVTFLYHPEKYNKDSILRSLIYRQAERRCFKKAKKVLTLSRVVKEEFSRIYGQGEKIEIVYPGVDEVKDFREGDINTVLCTTGPGTRKGFDYLIKAIGIIAKKNPKIKLKIAGVGVEYKHSIKPMLDNLGIYDNVVPTGSILGEELDMEYKNSGTIVVPSMYEGFGLPILEGMAYKKPVVTTPVGIAPEIIKDGENGLLVEKKNPEALAKAIEKVISDDALRRKISNGGYETSLKFTWKNSAKKTIEEYKKVLDNEN